MQQSTIAVLIHALYSMIPCPEQVDVILLHKHVVLELQCSM